MQFKEGAFEYVPIKLDLRLSIGSHMLNMKEVRGKEPIKIM